MKEPYNDSQPFPPEWEGENENRPELPEQLAKILKNLADLEAMHGAESQLNQTRQEWREILSKFALLSNMGLSGFERTKNPPETYENGFHGMARFNLDAKSIEVAGLTVEEVVEVWDIHMKEINDFFTSIKNRCIEEGWGEE